MIILLIIAFIALIIGSYTDIKTREVPDWITKGLIAIGIGLNLLFSVIYSNWNYFFNSLIGFAVFFVLALGMYRFGQWGGGDAKMIMGLGAMIGLKFSFDSFLLTFLFNLLIIGAIYGLLWSSVLSIKNRKKLIKEFKRLLKKKEVNRLKLPLIIALIVIGVLLLFVSSSLLRLTIASLGFFIALLFFILVYVRSVENACMLKYVTPDKLTEGDWIAKNIVVNKKIIAGPKDLGIEKKQIKKLIELYKQKKIKKVLIKEGIPFVPSFLVAFIVSYLWGNVLLWFV